MNVRARGLSFGRGEGSGRGVGERGVCVCVCVRVRIRVDRVKHGPARLVPVCGEDYVSGNYDEHYWCIPVFGWHSGVREGAEITGHYDPLMCKLVTRSCVCVIHFFFIILLLIIKILLCEYAVYLLFFTLFLKHAAKVCLRCCMAGDAWGDTRGRAGVPAAGSGRLRDPRRGPQSALPARRVRASSLH